MNTQESSLKMMNNSLNKNTIYQYTVKAPDSNGGSALEQEGSQRTSINNININPMNYRQDPNLVTGKFNDTLDQLLSLGGTAGRPG